MDVRYRAIENSIETRAKRNGKSKLLFFDIDGTLVPNGQDEGPDPETVRGLKATQKCGNKVILCTGRTLCDVLKIVNSVEPDGLIAGAGAYVWAEGNVIFHSVISKEMLSRTADEIIRSKVSCLFEGTYGFYYVGQGETTMPWDFPRIERAEDITGEESIEKFTAHVSSKEEFSRLRPWLEKYYDVYDHSGTFFEMVRHGMDKSVGVEKICRFYGAAREDTISFGDSKNDIPMLRSTGTGVAMGGAPEELLREATYVTDTLDNHGIVKALAALAVMDIKDSV